MRGKKLGGCLTMVVVVALLLPLHGRAISGCLQPCLPDDPGNFRGMEWGHQLSAAEGMRLVGPGGNDAGELYYVRRGDILTYGNARLDYVQYGFWRDMYSSVSFGTDGLRNWQALKRACFEDFQPWHQPDKRAETYYWVGRYSAMTLQYNDATQKGQLYIYSKVLYEKQLASARSTDAAPARKGFWHR